MPKKKKPKKGFILKMFPGNDKTQRSVASLLTVILFILAIAITLETVNSFYNESKIEAFSERVANTTLK